MEPSYRETLSYVVAAPDLGSIRLSHMAHEKNRNWAFHIEGALGYMYAAYESWNCTRIYLDCGDLCNGRPFND